MSTTSKKKQLFDETAEKIEAQGFSIIKQDQTRPWGGFFVINEDQAQKFADSYFEKMSMDEPNLSGKLSPKILIVEPDKRLSWQYHHRRAEIWKVVEGPVGVITSDTDEQGPLETYDAGDLVTLKQGERHRLVGLEDWAIIAEIWQHTDPNNPSDENDIVRVQDDFGR